MTIAAGTGTIKPALKPNEAPGSASAARGGIIPQVAPALLTPVGDFVVINVQPLNDSSSARPVGLTPPPADPHGPTVPVTVIYQPPAEAPK